jgi:alcohol dehydrogenase YqhD (iron-dependent ADH family)
MEHELSAVYDITHGLGLAILTPRWLEYCLDESNVKRYVSFGVNVFGIDPTLEPMAIARESIKRLADFFFNTLGLQRSFTEVGIKREDFESMARKACRYGDIKGFKTLTPEDVVRIYEMCL